MSGGTGIRGETVDEILWLDQPAGDPTELGMSKLVAGSFKFVDSLGAFNPRTGGGISESQHEALDTLVHEIDESSYDEVIYGSGNLASTYIVWETAAKLKKIREEQYTYAGSKVSQSVTIQYDGTGAVKMTVTETYTYSGSRVTSVIRTKS